MELYYIGFRESYRESPYLMYVSTATVKERAKTYKVEEWKTDYPTFRLSVRTFFNPETMEFLKITRKPYQVVFKKADIESVTIIENGYLGKDKIEVLKTIKHDIESQILKSNSMDYMLRQVKEELLRTKEERGFFDDDLSLEECNLSVKAYNTLKRHGITYLSELKDMSDDDLLKIRQFDLSVRKEVGEKIGRNLENIEEVPQ